MSDAPALVRRIPVRGSRQLPPDAFLAREWLVTNGLGGYASGTVAGVPTRRYHALLVAALPAPHGRRVLLEGVREVLRVPGRPRVALGGFAREDDAGESAVEPLVEFRLEDGLPVWVYEAQGVTLEKRLVLAHCSNTLVVRYALLGGAERIRLDLVVWVHHRPHEEAVGPVDPALYRVSGCVGRFEVSMPEELPPLRFFLHTTRGSFTLEGEHLTGIVYAIERRRGYPATGERWSPGRFHVDVSADHPASLVASTESWDAVLSCSPEEAFASERLRRARLVAAAHVDARAGVAAELVLAADQFVITPAARVEDEARARAAGEEARTVIAGYHWFTDWGRDTMISLEGLCLVTGRVPEACHILTTFARHVRDGLIPNLFPEGEREGLYHTADATLWYFHALHRYAAASGDRALLRSLLPVLQDVVEHHLRGTRFGIGVDPGDGLLAQGAPGYQLTWMDAKVGDWVVTPRRGKAVEVNALWYNALRLLEGWLREEGDDKAAKTLAAHAERARDSFNRRFWSPALGHLLDVVDQEGGGDDPACRPNQVFAVALDHPVLAEERWSLVLDAVRERLLTPCGLRSLAPGHADYKSHYDGDLRARDAAYHQGTVWAWLIGPFVDAWLKVHPDDRAGARRFLVGLAEHLDDGCIGTIAEIFDAEPPFNPRGCTAQAWSVAELLRCWVRTEGAGSGG